MRPPDTADPAPPRRSYLRKDGEDTGSRLRTNFRVTVTMPQLMKLIKTPATPP